MSTQTARNTKMSEAMNETLEGRIDETGRLVRKVDFSLSMLTLLSIVCVVLFLAILADHWLFADGLPTTLRLAVFLGLAGVAVFFVFRRIVPLFLYPINPVYSASILEESAPSLKNSIINWILLRREREEREGETDKISDRMFDGVTRSAASGMSAIPSDRAVDLRGLAHWGIILTLIFLFFVGYGIFSPKSPMTSLARIMLPLSHIRTPQEVEFHDIEPGNTVAQQGEHLTVSAELVGRTIGREPVYVFFSTDDGQAVWQAVPMTLPEGKIRHEAPFPPGKHGFVSGVDYWLQQGESRSEKYRIEVRPIASIEVVSLTYRYPEYTGLAEEVVENSGDIRAVEGTEVKIAVRSTLPLQRVDLVMDNDPAKATTMRLIGETEAVTTLTLRHDPESPTPTTVHSYTFRATDLEGYESRRSGVFRLEVLPDRPPVVQWSDTDEKLQDAVEIEVPLNGSLELPIQAEDPDFGLRYLRFHVESGTKRIRPVELLESSNLGPTKHIGPIRAKTVFSPVASRLAEGDTAEIRVEAIDTKLPEPNVAATRTITIRVGSPKKQEEQPKQEENKEEKQDGKEDKEKDKDKDQGENEKENDKKKDDDEKPAEDSEGEKSEDDEKSPNADDSGKQDHDRDPENGGEEKGDTGKDDKKDAEQERKSGEPDENREDPTGDRQQDEEKGKPSGDEQSGEEQSGDDKSTEENPDKNSKKDEKPGGEQKPGDDGEQQEQQSKDGYCDKKVDPNTQDGDAMERILEQMKKENKLPGEQKNEQKQDSSGDAEDSAKQDQKQESGKDKPKDSEPEQPQPKQQEPEQEAGEKPQQQQNKDCENGDCNKSDCQKCNGGGGGDKPDSKEGQSGEGNQGGGEGGQDGNEPAPEGGGGSDGTKADSENGKQESSGGQDGDGAADGTQKTDKESNQSGKPEGGSKDDSKGEAESVKQQGDEDGGGEGGGGEQSPGKPSGGDSTSGGGGQGDKNSGSSDKKGDNRNNDGEDVPVDPNDTEARERDRSLDPNSKDRRSQGGDATDPKRSDQTAKDVPQDTTSSGDEGKGQETRQQGRSDRTQSAEDGDMEGEQGENGVEKEGGDQGTGRQQEKEGGDSQAEQGEQSGNSPGSKSSEGEPQQNAPAGSQQPGEGEPSGTGSSMGPGGGDGGTPQQRPETPTPKEDANLEYSEKVTNLVLEYLEDQLKDEPNPELLDSLGWSEEELRGFYRKWKEMSDGQRRPDRAEDDDSARAWKEALKSIGLRPTRERQGQRQSHTEFKDTGSSAESLRYAPPKAMQKRFQRYTEGIGTGGKRE